ncbi:class I SAM-dependent methyltransferase [Thermococcus sp. LS2]|uniref:class I SAM-dependent methyltransferase n=1 Tax=Thermococcus sp. LS2 TaxID=1638260 RepID=UPI0014389FFB
MEGGIAKFDFDIDYFKGGKGSSYKNYHKVGRRVYELTLAELKRFIKSENINPREFSILVVGCAYGYECKASSDLGFKRVVGVDISEHAVSEAKKTFPEIEFYVRDACNLEFEDKEFDIILANNILEHLPDPRVALKEFHRVAKRYVIVRLDNVFAIELFNSLPIGLRKIIGKLTGLPIELDTDLTHISQLPRYKWIQLFRSYQFNVKQIFSISKFPVIFAGFHHYILEVK